jgi:hypothetical protein
MTINRKRLIALAEWAAAQDARRRLGLPNEWVQANWLTKLSCGTACCLAGKVALEDGGKPYLRDEHWEETYEYDIASRVTFPGEPKPVWVSEYAQEVLGLTEEQRLKLFASTNDLDDVLRVIGELLNPIELAS